jgi:hypothetical protein
MSDLPLNLILTFEPEALSLLKARYGAALRLRPSPSCDHCGEEIRLPVVEPGLPPSPSGWQQLQVEGIRVYIEPGLLLPEDKILHISVDQFYMWTNFWVEGIENSVE